MGEKMTEELQVNDQDLAFALNQKANEATGLLVQVAALKRGITEREARIAELERTIASLNGKEPANAESGGEEIPVYN
jgi:uncharacterized protein (DUF3084 family)